MRDVAWSHWTELGVAGPFRRHTDVLIDPEALILFTAELGDLDPRLRDESLDWCVRFGDSISVSRLKNLLRQGLGSEASLDRYAGVVNATSSLRWPVKSRRRGEDGPAPGRSVSRGKSHEPDLSRPALLRLRMRAIFGVGTRADVLTELLYGSRRSAAELAAIGYSKRQVASSLDDLTRAGVLSRTTEGNTHRFELADPRALEPLAGAPTTYHAHWADCFRVLLSFHRLIEEQDEKSDRLRALASRRVLTKIVSSLERLRWGMPVAATADTLWPRTVTWAVEKAERAARGAPDPRNVSYLASLPRPGGRDESSAG